VRTGEGGGHAAEIAGVLPVRRASARNRPVRRATFVLLMLIGLAVILPAKSLAQSAGDEQYVDPFQNEPQQGGSGGGGNAGGGGGSPDTSGGGSPDTSGGSQGTPAGGEEGETGGTTEPAPPPPSEEGGGFGATASGSSGTGSDVLPITGLPAALTVLLGAVLLASGVALRRGA
jgi:hypothetical protein